MPDQSDSYWDTVWKYEIPVEDFFKVEMPRLAKVVHVGVQDDRPYMWARVSLTQPLMSRTFYVHGTGHRVRPLEVYLGTFVILGGSFVGHLFEPRQS